MSGQTRSPATTKVIVETQLLIVLVIAPLGSGNPCPGWRLSERSPGNAGKTWRHPGFCCRSARTVGERIGARLEISAETVGTYKARA